MQSIALPNGSPTYQAGIFATRLPREGLCPNYMAIDTIKFQYEPLVHWGMSKGCTATLRLAIAFVKLKLLCHIYVPNVIMGYCRAWVYYSKSNSYHSGDAVFFLALDLDSIGGLSRDLDPAGALKAGTGILEPGALDLT